MILSSVALDVSPSPAKRHEALPEAIANRVAEAIATRELAAGQRIVETSLAAQLNVSRVPVREALKVLHTQGIISGGGHRGFRVASFSAKMVQSVQEARIELETLILRDAVQAWREGHSNIAVLETAIGVMRDAARRGDFREMLRADIAFHAAICEAACNPIFASLWRAIARHLLIILNLARFRDIDLRVVVRRHEALRDQIRGLVAHPDRISEARGILAAHFLAERQAHGLATEADIAPTEPQSRPAPSTSLRGKAKRT